jgi:threonyl-tRNA synthetase
MLLIEHYAGKFPLWLSPEQLRIIQVKDSEDVMEFVQQLRTKAEAVGLRVFVDDTNESVGKKIRSAEVWKVPYTVVIGEKEVQGQRVSPRVRADLAVLGDVERNYSVDQLLASLANEVKARASKSSI